MTLRRRLLVLCVGLLALGIELVKLVASLVMLGAVLLVIWCCSVPGTFLEAFNAVRGPKDE